MKLQDLSFHKNSKKYIVLPLLIALAFCVFFFWKDIYVFMSYRDGGERQVQRILLDVKEKAELPVDELPGLATIEDKTKLSQGGVLKNAQNGDKILLFYKSAQAILYRPSTAKVVAIGPLIADASIDQVQGTRIGVKNGGTDNVKYDAMVDRLRQSYPSATVSGLGDASRSDFPQSIAIDFTDKNSKADFVTAINEKIATQTGILPIGEEKPADTDILIIVGID